ncbi:hypothetical protein [Bdellovibrio sp. HCB274]|uniref:hypothetical protein n=1 Tax=Bdellovibrio sp. HCB274 TaxID=3394361 RepID=UPI0039B4AA97
MESQYRIRIKNGEFEVEIESTDQKFVETKLKEYASLKQETPNVSREISTITVSLAKFIKDHNINNQVQKFLAAAVYLSEKGKTFMKTSDVNLALKDAGQNRLANASECLNQNIKKGYLDKTGSNEFMVTVHGKEQFGIDI